MVDETTKPEETSEVAPVAAAEELKTEEKVETTE